MATRKEQVQIVVSAKDKAKGALSGLKKQIIGIGAAFAGLAAVKGIFSDIISKTAETERVYKQLSQALEHHGYVWSQIEGAVRDYTGAAQEATGISDELVATGLQNMVTYGMSATEAMDNMTLAMDLAVGGGMDLKAAADLIGKAFVGYTGTLSRYGIIIDESIPKTEKFGIAVSQIQERFGGAAQAQMDIAIGQWNRLTEAIGDLEETIGKEGSSISEFFKKTADLVSGLNVAIANDIGFMDTLGAHLKTLWGDYSDIADQVGTIIDKSKENAEALAEAEVVASTEKAKQAAQERIDAINEERAAVQIYFEEQAIGHTDNLYLQQQNAEWIKANASETTEILTMEQKLVNLSHQMGAEVAIEAYGEIQEKAKETAEIQHEAITEDLEAYMEANEAKRAAARITAQEMGKLTAQLGNAMIASFNRTKRSVTQIWEDMYRAFMTYFIKKILIQMLPGGPFWSQFITGLQFFDVAANDRMAVQQGADYARYFTEGMNQQLVAFVPNPSPAFNGPMFNGTNGPPAGSVINITISADVDEGSVRNKIAPILEELANNRFTDIVYDESTITGDSAIEFA